MGLEWHLDEVLAERDLSREALQDRLSFSLGAAEALNDLTLRDLAELLQVLEAQPGDLLSFTPESPAEQAARQLARNLSFQSFLDFRRSREAEGDD